MVNWLLTFLIPDRKKKSCLYISPRHPCNHHLVSLSLRCCFVLVGTRESGTWRSCAATDDGMYGPDETLRTVAPTSNLPTRTVQVQIFGGGRLTDAASLLMTQSPQPSANIAPWRGTKPLSGSHVRVAPAARGGPRGCCLGTFRKNCTVIIRRLRIAIQSGRVPHRRQHGKRCVVGRPHRTHTLNSHGCIVHGSLARAGKVKSQTPKVEKQEKKKNPRGRAKKRMLYNRRYATA